MIGDSLFNGRHDVLPNDCRCSPHLLMNVEDGLIEKHHCASIVFHSHLVLRTLMSAATVFDLSVLLLLLL